MRSVSAARLANALAGRAHAPGPSKQWGRRETVASGAKQAPPPSVTSSAAWALPQAPPPGKTPPPPTLLKSQRVPSAFSPSPLDVRLFFCANKKNWHSWPFTTCRLASSSLPCESVLCSPAARGVPATVLPAWQFTMLSRSYFPGLLAQAVRNRADRSARSRPAGMGAGPNTASRIPRPATPRASLRCRAACRRHLFQRVRAGAAAACVSAHPLVSVPPSSPLNPALQNGAGGHPGLAVQHRGHSMRRAAAQAVKLHRHIHSQDHKRGAGPVNRRLNFWRQRVYGAAELTSREKTRAWVQCSREHDRGGSTALSRYARGRSCALDASL